MATHSSILAWRIPWTRGPVGYSPWGRKGSNMIERLTHTQRTELRILQNHLHLNSEKMQILPTFTSY